MKILVVGDSFCNKVSHDTTKHAWTRVLHIMLCAELPGTKVHCVGQAGSSVFSALHTTREHVNKNAYDVIIAIIADHERLYQRGEYEPQVSSLPHALVLLERHKRSKTKDQNVLNRIEAGRMYYEYLYEPNLGIFTLESCLKEFQTEFPGKQVIIFPAFDNYTNSTYACSVFDQHPFNLMEVVYKEDKNFTQLQSNTSYQEIEVIHNNQIGKINHMHPTNQHTLARYFADLILHGKSDINIDNFVSIPVEEFKYYYRPLEL